MSAARRKWADTKILLKCCERDEKSSVTWKKKKSSIKLGNRREISYICYRKKKIKGYKKLVSSSNVIWRSFSQRPPLKPDVCYQTSRRSLTNWLIICKLLVPHYFSFSRFVDRVYVFLNSLHYILKNYSVEFSLSGKKGFLFPNRIYGETFFFFVCLRWFPFFTELEHAHAAATTRFWVKMLWKAKRRWRLHHNAPSN